MTETNIKDFLLENVDSPVAEKEVHFKRFKSPFKIKSLTAEEMTVLRGQVTRKVLNKRTHQFEQQTDQNRFTDSIITASVVSPDLQNEELQKSWGCLAEPGKLLRTMLTMGEYQELAQTVMDISDMNADDVNDLTETVKN